MPLGGKIWIFISLHKLMSLAGGSCVWPKSKTKSCWEKQCNRGITNFTIPARCPDALLFVRSPAFPKHPDLKWKEKPISYSLLSHSVQLCICVIYHQNNCLYDCFLIAKDYSHCQGFSLLAYRLWGYPGPGLGPEPHLYHFLSDVFSVQQAHRLEVPYPTSPGYWLWRGDSWVWKADLEKKEMGKFEILLSMTC